MTMTLCRRDRWMRRVKWMVPAVVWIGLPWAVGSAATVEQVLEVEPVWAGHPVQFCLHSEGGYQYAAYYDAERRMRVAMRKLPETEWTFTTLPTRVGWDSHNYIRMELDRRGFIHLSGNMHCVPLIYFRSQRPYDATTLERVERMVGSQENRCTYPLFFHGPQGELIFRYRDGGSGNGNEIFNVYDEQTQRWRRLLDRPLTDGRGRMNAYIRGPVRGPDGWFHISWVWRDTPDCSTNHDLSYARSRDLMHWQTVDGRRIELPMTRETAGVVVDPVPAQGGILNGCGAIGFDGDGRVVLSYYKFDEKGKTQAYCARAEDGRWAIYRISDWDYRWYFSGYGSIITEIHLGAVRAAADGTLRLDYSHSKYGSGMWKLDARTFRVLGRLPREQRIPAALGKVESDFPGMQVRWAEGTGDDGRADVTYWLRWETLGRNRDRPRRGPLPGPSTLRVYALRED